MNKLVKKSIVLSAVSIGLFAGMTALVHGAGAAAPSSLYSHEILPYFTGFSDFC